MKAKTLIDRLVRLGWCGRGIADALGRDVCTVSRWRRGHREPHPHAVLELEALLTQPPRGPRNHGPRGRKEPP